MGPDAADQIDAFGGGVGAYFIVKFQFLLSQFAHIAQDRDFAAV